MSSVVELCRGPAWRRLSPALAVLLFLVAAASCARLPPLHLDLSALTCRAIAPDAAPAVDWIAPADRRSLAAIPRWCATVGPVFFDARPAGQPSRISDTLVVVSWNIHVGSADVDDLVRRLKRGEFTGGAPVTDFVLLLQEAVRRDESVPGSLDRRLPLPRRIAHRPRLGDDDVRTVARGHGLALLYAPAMRNGVPAAHEDRGNAIASTFTLHDAQVLELPFEHQRRVVPMATVEGITTAGETWRVRLADVHFDTALALTRGGPFTARRREADALVATLTDSLGPTVAAGDFNAWLGGREAAVGTLRSAFPQTPRPDGRPTWRGPLGIRATLDHVFVRGAVRSVAVRRLPARFGSDHYPLLATLSF